MFNLKPVPNPFHALLDKFQPFGAPHMTTTPDDFDKYREIDKRFDEDLRQTEKLIKSGSYGKPATPFPTVGRIVHYYRHRGEQPMAALVTGVYNDTNNVDLSIFPRGGNIWSMVNVPYAAAPVSDHWTWPPRI